MPRAHRRCLTSCCAQGWFQFKGCFRRLISHPTDVVLQFPPTTCAVSTDGQAARRQEDEIERECERMPDKARSRGQGGHGVGGGKQKGEAVAPASEDERRERQRKRERSREQQREQEREGRQGRDVLSCASFCPLPPSDGSAGGAGTGHDVKLQFTLGAGQYATMLLRCVFCVCMSVCESMMTRWAFVLLERRDNNKGTGTE